jgi:hypothetical protein
MQQLSEQPAFELSAIVRTPGALAALNKFRWAATFDSVFASRLCDAAQTVRHWAGIVSSQT